MFETVYSSLQVALVFLGNAQIAIGLGIVRIDFKNLFETVYGSVKLLQASVGRTLNIVQSW
ncbi:MAG: hypothetical protein ABJH71_19710 [Anderseniella sp.]